METNHYKRIKQILWVILGANLLVAVLKILYGILIKSASMTADGYHSLTDGSSNIIGLIGVTLASIPVDEDHPYGHKKFETLGGLVIAGILTFIGIKTIIEAFSRFLHPVQPEVSDTSVIVLVLTLIVNILVSRFELKEGRRLNSDILISDSMHTRSDIFISIGVIVTLIGLKAGLPPLIDPAASLVVSGFILHAAYEIIRFTSDVLLDRAVIDSDKIRDIVMSFQQVKNCHKIRSRGRNDDIFIDLHIMVAPETSVEASHELMHSIEEKINEAFKNRTQVIVHIEPYYALSQKGASLTSLRNS